MFKTLQVSGDHPYGGGGYLFEKWCDYLLSKGCRVDVVRTDAYSVERLKEMRGLNVIDEIWIPREIVPLQHARAFVQLLRLMHRGRYDVVHTYNATPGVLGRVAARLSGVPVILHHQAGWTIKEDSSPLERVLFTALEYLGALAGTGSICVSRAIAQQASELHTAPLARLVVIPNGIDPRPLASSDRSAARRALLARLGIPGDPFLIGNASRLVAEKGNDLLVRALVELQPLLGDTPYVLLLAGDGRARSTLAALASSLGVESRVRLLGFERDIPAFLAALDVFVTPSLREGLSIALLEAMAAGKPIVASAIPQNQEVIQHGVTGLLVPTRDAGAIAQAIARFTKSPELARACGEQARQRLLRDHTLERCLDATFELCQEQLQRRRRTPLRPGVPATPG